MNEYLSFGLLAFTSFLSLINPFGIMPVFMTMTNSMTTDQRRFTARKATVVAFFTLLAFAFSGQLIFNFFNITVNSFRVVGGIIFFMMGRDMLNARLVSVKLEKEEVKEYATDISITPLAIPILCGPGAITNSIVLMEDSKDYVEVIILITVILLILLLTLLVLYLSDPIMKLLGNTGNKILMRLMGLIVMVIAVEFFLSGLRPIIRDMLLITP